MPTPLNILLVEDSQNDAELIVAELHRAGFEPNWKRVEIESDFLSEIQKTPDIILSDYSMPQFTGLRAAELLRESGLNIPFILISGTVGEEFAVEAMQHGATDYLLKDRLTRLGIAVEKALEQKQLYEQQKLAEEALRASEEKYRKIFENVQDVFYQTDNHGKIIEISPSIERYSGFRRDELIGRPVTEVYYNAEDRAKMLKVIQEKGEVVDYELRLKNKTGRLIYTSANAHVLFDVQGKPAGIEGALRDITERKQADEKLRQSEAALAEGQRVAKLGIWRLDIAGNKVRWSDELYRIFDVEPAVFRGTYENFLNCVLPDDRAHVFQTNADAKANGGSFEMEYRIQTRAGHLKTIHEIGYAMKDAEGRVVELFGTAQDITERKRAEEELRESELKFRQIAENIREVFWVTDPAKQRVVYISPAYENIWGRTCQSLYDSPQTWLAAIHPDDRARVSQAALTKQTVENFAAYDEEYRIIKPDKTVLWIHDRAFPIHNAAGEIYRIVGVAEDITEKRILEAQFRQAQKMESIGQLAGGIAHDFNNILAAMMMQAELAGIAGNTPEEMRRGLLEIRAAAERAANLTRQLLLFSRKQVMQPRKLNLNSIVNGLAKMLQRLIREDVSLQLHLHSAPLMTYADAGMLDQLLMNLAVNARDAMPGGGKLVIETAEKVIDAGQAALNPEATPGRYVWLCVSDTGCGIPPEVLPRIFEPFFTTKEPGKGTGLGLATVFGIVKQHHGWLKVDSEVGKGTTVQIFLPASDVSADEASAGEKAKSKRRGGSEIILVVEDDPSVRMLTRIILERHGYRVLEASNGVEAQQIWTKQQGRIILLLTDLVMPGGMDGRELAARLQSQKPGLKIIFTSGYSAEIAGSELKLKAGQTFVQKPCPPDQLLETIRSCLDA